MMRSRIISPEFFRDEDIARLEEVQKVLFIGLWTLSDRQGRLVDNQVYIKSNLFPYSDVITSNDIARHLDALASPHPFIIRYTVEGKRFIQIKNWDKYQRVHPHERQSSIPPVPDVITSNDIARHFPDMSRQCNWMSPTSTSTSNIPPTPLTTGRVRTTAPRKPKVNPEQEAWFTEWYEKYPRHEAKPKAKQSFCREVQDETTFAAVMAGLNRQLPGLLAKEIQYRPLPATWINQRRWEDEVEPALFTPPSVEPPKQLSADEYFARLMAPPTPNA
jgi:hypothetical protein